MPGDALLRVGDPQYLKTLGARLLEGRLPESRDTGGAPQVIVVNETLAKRWWPHESALGHRITLNARTPVWRTIIQETMLRVDQLLAGVDGSAELKVIRYPA